jgi:membrane protease YdiL (CAAX protease family)
VENQSVNSPLNLRNHKHELLLVLFVSLGASAIYSVLSLLRKLNSSVGLAGSVTTINQPLAQNPWLDLVSQIASITLSLVPVLLALYFLRLDRINIGAIPRPKDFGIAALIAAGIGIPGIGLYWLALEFGLTSQIIPSALADNWWSIPVLVLAALRAGLQEEIIMLGFFIRKLKLIDPRYSMVVLIIASSLIRGTYHLYQGFSGFLGNFLMGLLFGWVFYKTGRVAPLIIAHTLMNIVVFIGYPIAAPYLFGT